MHSFDFTLFAWIFGIALVLLVLSVLGMAFVVPRFHGPGAIGLMWVLGIVAVVAAIVAFVLGGLWVHY